MKNQQITLRIGKAPRLPLLTRLGRIVDRTAQLTWSFLGAAAVLSLAVAPYLHMTSR